MEFDTSDVVVFPSVIQPVEEVIALEEDDMLEAACLVPRRQPAGTAPPSLQDPSARTSATGLEPAEVHERRRID